MTAGAESAEVPEEPHKATAPTPSTGVQPAGICCRSCGQDLNLDLQHQFPHSVHFEAGHSKSVSFSAADQSRIGTREEEAWGPFFESVECWGIHRIRTVLVCGGCKAKLGVLMHDGPPVGGNRGHSGFGPSQMIPRVSRYRFWEKATTAASPKDVK